MSISSKKQIGDLSSIFNSYQDKLFLPELFVFENVNIYENKEYDAEATHVLKSLIYILKRKASFLQLISDKAIFSEEVTVLIIRYFNFLDSQIERSLSYHLITSNIKSSPIRKYIDLIDETQPSDFLNLPSQKQSEYTKSTIGFLEFLNQYAVTESTKTNLVKEKVAVFNKVEELISNDRKTLEDSNLTVDQFPTDPKKFWVTRKEDDYYFKNEKLKHNTGGSLVSQILMTTLNIIGERDFVSYEELIPYIRKNIKKFRKFKDSAIISQIQKALTSKQHGINRFPNTMLKDNNQPLFSTTRGKGINFFNKR